MNIFRSCIDTISTVPSQEPSSFYSFLSLAHYLILFFLSSCHVLLPVVLSPRRVILILWPIYSNFLVSIMCWIQVVLAGYYQRIQLGMRAKALLFQHGQVLMICLNLVLVQKTRSRVPQSFVLNVNFQLAIVDFVQQLLQLSSIAS